MKKLLKCLTLLSVVLILQGCPLWEQSLKSQITGVWQCDQIKSKEWNASPNEIWEFYSSGKLTISGVEGRPNGIWNGTWSVDEQNSLLHIKENTNKYDVNKWEDYQIKSVNSSSMKLFTGSTSGYWEEHTFSKYKEPSGAIGAPKK